MTDGTNPEHGDNMTEKKDSKSTQVDGFACAECGVWGPYGEVHTWLFCELHKMGHDRRTIVANVKFTSRLLQGVEADTIQWCKQHKSATFRKRDVRCRAWGTDPGVCVVEPMLLIDPGSQP